MTEPELAFLKASIDKVVLLETVHDGIPASAAEAAIRPKLRPRGNHIRHLVHETHNPQAYP